MRRRDLIKNAAALAVVSATRSQIACAINEGVPQKRTRPGDPAWPTEADWDRLNQEVGGRSIRPVSPFADCESASGVARCRNALKQIGNPYFVGDEPALTQTSGWVDAWNSRPSAYAVAAEQTSDVVAAVNFARTRNLRLVVKGGGHSYQGTSSSPDSLLVWTRRMNDVTVHESFVPRGCTSSRQSQPAVTIGAGAMWTDAYNAVTTRTGRYVQGGGCTNVGVAGLILSGGFGNFSKAFGTAAAGLLEAEIVTADGRVRIVNDCTSADLFWTLKGGGGGSLGVVTRLTLRTRELPEYFGAVFGTVKASSDSAFRDLVAKIIEFYKTELFNPHWGEQIVFQGGNTVRVSMVFQGLKQKQARATWAPFLNWVSDSNMLSIVSDFQFLSLPARHFWDADFYRQHAPKLVVSDDRLSAPGHHTTWAGDLGQVGWFIHAYRSAWLPSKLLDHSHQSALVDALFASTRHWEVALHFNKGLAGAPPEEIRAARDTATNPKVLDAFALAIVGATGSPAFQGMPGASSGLSTARANAKHVCQAMDALLRAAPDAGSYVSESDYFQKNWQSSFWGSNYPRLARVKQKYDPNGLFIVYHGVGSEGWSDDGFMRLRS